MLSRDSLTIDAAETTDKIVAAMRSTLWRMHRKGAVLGLSGGIDSSVCCALAVRAFGKERVLGLFMPERDTSDDALTYAQLLATGLGIETQLENIGPALQALGCYERQASAIRTIEPGYGEGWKFKLVIPSLREGNRLNLTRLVVESPSGEVVTHRLSAAAYAQIVAATNYKQRIRKVTEYYHADRLSYAVLGTPNRLEYDQGFFVKLGDGAADIKPIAHLYKSQVYQLAEHLGVPSEIRARTPTTDTFSLAQTQEEFYFALPYREMDFCLYALNHRRPTHEVASVTGLTEEQVGRVYEDIASKRRATKYLHLAPQLVEGVLEV